MGRTAQTHNLKLAHYQLLDGVTARGFRPEFAMFDKGYDGRFVYEGCAARGIRPIIPLRKNTRGEQPDEAPSCEHGDWTFAGSDAKRGASKWRCPTAECSPASVWVKANRVHPLVPRSTNRWRALYRQRGAVEREFGRLKHEWALLPLRVRCIERVRLHANLSILGRLASVASSPAFLLHCPFPIDGDKDGVINTARVLVARVFPVVLPGGSFGYAGLTDRGESPIDAIRSLDSPVEIAPEHEPEAALEEPSPPALIPRLAWFP
jgi:hypothetical protein